MKANRPIEEMGDAELVPAVRVAFVLGYESINWRGNMLRLEKELGAARIKDTEGRNYFFAGDVKRYLRHKVGEPASAEIPTGSGSEASMTVMTELPNNDLSYAEIRRSLSLDE